MLWQKMALVVFGALARVSAKTKCDYLCGRLYQHGIQLLFYSINKTAQPIPKMIGIAQLPLLFISSLLFCKFCGNPG
jgi:hypothetical protein